MRSRNVSPGLAVIATTMRSDSTRVPPVTLERSPPDSRITGADSPVMADSSTLAMPSTISPSAGIRSPASHTTRSPLRRSGAGVGTSAPSTSWRAIVVVRVLRSASAWALPRPSASASAKFANSTVSHSQIAIWISNVGVAGALDQVDDQLAGDERADDLDRQDHGVAQQRARDRACGTTRPAPARAIGQSNRPGLDAAIRTALR